MPVVVMGASSDSGTGIVMIDGLCALAVAVAAVMAAALTIRGGTGTMNGGTTVGINTVGCDAVSAGTPPNATTRTPPVTVHVAALTAPADGDMLMLFTATAHAACVLVLAVGESETAPVGAAKNVATAATHEELVLGEVAVTTPVAAVT
jgi:hypothetical protein